MNTTLTYEDLLSQIERDIHFGALRYRNIADVEDLEQEARLLVWQAWERIIQTSNPVQYAKGVAHNAMVRVLARRQKSVKTESLEEYLCWQDSDGDTMQRDIVDIPNPKRLSSKTMRHRVLTALDGLGKQQRRAVMSFYRIENRQGRVSERHGTLVEYQNKYRGIVKLRKVMVG